MPETSQKTSSDTGNPIAFGQLYNADDCAALLKCGTETIRRAWNTGALPFVQTGRQRRMTEDQLEGVVANGGFKSAVAS